MTTAKKPWMSSLGQTFLLVGGWMSGIHPKKVTDVEIWIAQGPQMAPQHSQFWQTVVLGSSGAAGECWRVRDGHIPNKIHLVHGIHTYNHIIIYIYIHTRTTYRDTWHIYYSMQHMYRYDWYGIRHLCTYTTPHKHTHHTHIHISDRERVEILYVCACAKHSKIVPEITASKAPSRRLRTNPEKHKQQQQNKT